MKITINKIKDAKTNTYYSAVVESDDQWTNFINITAEMIPTNENEENIKLIEGQLECAIPIIKADNLTNYNFKPTHIESKCINADDLLKVMVALRGHGLIKDLVKRYIFKYTKEELKKLN